MKRIYTRTGDKGSTAIHGGERVAKTDIRIEANGCVDELNVAIGMLRTLLGNEHQWQEMLREIQLNLMTMMSLIATRQEKRIDNPNTLPEDIVAQTESIIDCLNEECTPPDSFILPGGTLAVAQIHQCRVLARRAERRLWSLNELDEVPELLLCYFNRLSDLFFIMARWELQHSGCQEEIWKEFGYKRKLK
jgi:ATP:cob(I)alamin adenosyltransferase